MDIRPRYARGAHAHARTRAISSSTGPRVDHGTMRYYHATSAVPAILAEGWACVMCTTWSSTSGHAAISALMLMCGCGRPDAFGLHQERTTTTLPDARPSPT